MHVVKSPDYQEGATALAARLNTELVDGPVLWLVSGGSNIAVAMVVLKQLTDTSNLTIALIDERYGPVGHADSNWEQLLQAGFDPTKVRSFPVLTDDRQSLHGAAEAYEHRLSAELDQKPFVIGQFGIGPDGHTSGILPHSVAVEATGLVTSYESTPYQRITTTFEAIKRCDAAYIFAFGDDKRTALTNLARDLSLAEEPAQIFKQLSDVTLYNDQGGETI